jgi:hypothetical protein
MRHKLRQSILAATLLGALATQGYAQTFVPGYLKFEAWAQGPDGLPAELAGANLDDAALLPLIPTFAPPQVLYMSAFNTRTVYPNDSHENYLARITGVIVVPETADYHFFLRSDDDGRLYLNKTGETPPDITSGTVVPLIKEDLDCCDGFIAPGVDTDGDGFGDTAADGTTANTDAEATTVAPIRLTAGTRYGITVLLKEGGGGDWLEVDVRKVGDTRANAPLPGSFLGVSAPALAITTQPVATLATSENFPATLSVRPGNGEYPGVTFQWRANGTPIPGATNGTYTFTPTQADDGKVYSVVLTSGSQTVTSGNSTLDVTNDTTAPTIVSAGSFVGGRAVMVTFSEGIGTGLGVAANYALSGGATVASAEAVGNNAVVLRTAAALTSGTSYTVTVSNVRDLASGGGNLVTPNTASFTQIATPAGTAINFADWQEYLGATMDGLDDAIAGGTAPDDQRLMPSFEAPVNTAEGFTGRLRGFFVPPQTGDYVFYGSADDNARFYLSTDSDAGNKKQIGAESAWSNNREWTTSGGGSSLPNKRSDQYAATQWPSGNRITLVGGLPYYLEARYTEGGGGDNGSMTFKLASETDPGSGTPTRVVGTNLVWYGDPTQIPLTVLMEGSKVFKRGDTVTLSPTVAGPGTITYQWYKSKKPITGATSRVLTLTNADYDDIGDYQLEASNGVSDPVRGNAGAADDNSRLYMDGITMLVEAEDYNYGGGQHKTEADAPSYRGNAYLGLKGTLDIDFFHDGDNSAGAAFAYQRATPTDEGVIEDKGGTDAVNNALGRNRGSFEVTANYALGWTAATEWQNYTRTFAPGKYVVIGAMSHDGLVDDPPEINMILSKVANPTLADGSAVGTEGAAQGLTKLGTFLSPGTGAWSSNDLIPLTDDAGNIVQLNLSGLTTLRLTFNAQDGDADWMAFYCIDCTTPTNGTATISLAKTGGTISITYTGVLQAAATVAGPYTDVAGATSPFTPPGATTGNRFFRTRAN